jgi:uncharacterized protein
MVPAMCFSTIRQFIYFGGVFESAWAWWTYAYMSPDTRERQGLEGPRTVAAARAEWQRLGGDRVFQGYVPSLLMPYLQDVALYYYDWILHQPYEDWWEWGNLRTRYDEVQAAVLNLSGWYDEAYGSEGAITNFLGLLAARAGQTDPRTSLVIGPWTHGVGATEAASAGDRHFDPSAAIDYDDVVLDWLDAHLRDGQDEPWSAARVRFFVMGDNVWRDSDRWPVEETAPTALALGPAADGSGSGSLGFEPVPDEGVRSFVADPAHPVIDEFGTNFGAFDLRDLSERSGVLTYDSDLLTEDLEVTGQIRAEIYVSSDAPDLDLYVKLIDVSPDGTAFNLMSTGHEVLRASYRDATAERKLLKPGQVVKLTLDNLLTANTFKAGHRLRVCIMASWFPTYSRNLQTGELESTSGVMKRATINIHHGPQYPSRLILPVIPGS